MVIDGRTEPDDLKWRVDALARLSDAQGGRGEGRGVKEELAYVRPQVLWWAYEWTGAQAHHDKYQLPKPEVHVPPNWNANADRCVVLLDEIDKADPDLPNALLDVLANKGFIPPFAGAKTVRCTQATRPLILITTNEERELPAAFLRRCLVHTLTLPEGKKLEAYLSELAERHQAHRVARLPEQQCHIIPEVAAHFMLLHEEAKQTDDYVPGTSEFLDLVQALAVLYPGRSPVARQPQLDALEQLAMFVRKSALTDR
jgi:MoxR-like ATPase